MPPLAAGDTHITFATGVTRLLSAHARTRPRVDERRHLMCQARVKIAHSHHHHRISVEISPMMRRSYAQSRPRCHAFTLPRKYDGISPSSMATQGSHRPITIFAIVMSCAAKRVSAGIDYTAQAAHFSLPDEQMLTFNIHAREEQGIGLAISVIDFS